MVAARLAADYRMLMAESNLEKASSAFALARSYQAGNVSALGAMLTEIVVGSCLK